MGVRTLAVLEAAAAVVVVPETSELGPSALQVQAMGLLERVREQAAEEGEVAAEATGNLWAQ